MKVFSRAPGDEFAFDLAYRLSQGYESYYVWAGNPISVTNFLQTTFGSSVVVIAFRDLLELNVEFNFWTDLTQYGVKKIIEKIKQYPTTHFIILTSMEHLSKEINEPNASIVPCGGDITNHAVLYPTVDPIIDKNLDSEKTFISLNRHPRAHRLVLLSYLFGTKYNQHGFITYIGQDKFNLPDCILDVVSWQFSDYHTPQRELILQGYKQFYNNRSLVETDYESIYPTHNDNVDNFIHRLGKLYKNSFVEIVTETSFAQPSFMITEKTLNSIYGCNFPILLSGVGAVNHLREIGFDLFDDVVDHSYDQIHNPFDRIIAAIEDNKQLLLDARYTKEQWQQNKSRFESNVYIAKHKMYKWYQDRAIDQFANIKCH